MRKGPNQIDFLPGGVAAVHIGGGLVTMVDARDVSAIVAYRWKRLVQRAGRVYAAAKIPGTQRTVLMHRLLCDPPRGAVVDHKNNDPLDNRRSNLRLATPSQNNCNAKRRRDNTSGYVGVSFDKVRGKWAARIMWRGRQKSIGRYDTALEAAMARDAATRELHGEFGTLNFPAGVQ